MSAGSVDSTRTPPPIATSVSKHSTVATTGVPTFGRSTVVVALRGVTVPEPLGPVAPVGPGGPPTPGSPIGPGGPTGPDAPGAPGGPEIPGLPAGPIGPTGPVGPGTPLQTMWQAWRRDGTTARGAVALASTVAIIRTTIPLPRLG